MSADKKARNRMIYGSNEMMWRRRTAMQMSVETNKMPAQEYVIHARPPHLDCVELMSGFNTFTRVLTRHKGLVKKHYKNQLNSTENTQHQRVHSKVPYNVIPLVGWCAVVLPGSRSRWGGQSPAAFLW